MTAFQDLDPLSYFGEQYTALRAVGWLERDSQFETGVVADSFFAALVRLCVNPWQLAATAGRHACSLCCFSGGPAHITYENSQIAIGTANLFVPTPEVVFVAPTTMLHYIDAHQYLPPPEFQQAVLQCPQMRSLPYLKAIQAHGLIQPSARR